MAVPQAKNQPNQFSGKESECAFVLELVDLMKFEVVVTRGLGDASSRGAGGFQSESRADFFTKLSDPEKNEVLRWRGTPMLWAFCAADTWLIPAIAPGWCSTRHERQCGYSVPHISKWSYSVWPPPDTAILSPGASGPAAGQPGTLRKKRERSRCSLP